MKKRTLKEELERIHTITYGRNFLIGENLINKILQYDGEDEQPKIDDPKKADYVGSNVDKFFSDLKQINEPITQQVLGTMEYQKDVELCQMSLVLLGYELPRHGIDGLFGPETANAVREYKQDNNILSEATSQYMGGDNVKVSGGVDSNIDTILQDKIESIANEYGGAFKITSAYRDLNKNSEIGGAKNSSHLRHKAVDIVLNDKTKENTLRFITISSQNGIGGIGVYGPGVLHIDIDGRRAWGPTHGRESVPSWAESTIKDHLSSNIGGNYVPTMVGDDSEGESLEVITLGMIESMISKLEMRGVTEEELSKLVDEVKTGGGADFTDLDLTTDEGFNKYRELSDKFIKSRLPNPLNITGEMIASAAKNAFIKYKKYVPPELALAQLAQEGGIGNGDPKIRPIITKNPFNVGNYDDGTNVDMGSVENGVNSYFKLIARDYLGKGKTANDLIQNFVNHDGLRYAGPEYEKAINQLARQINRMSKSMN